MLPPKHRDFFKKLLAQDFEDDSAYLRAYAYDATRQKFLPDCVIYPRNEEEIAKILLYCSTHKIPVVPRGAGSGMSGGALCVSGGVVLAMEKYFHQILEIDTKNMLARVQPGVINKDFQKAVQELGLFYPPDPASQDFSTLGGNVSENAGGMRAVKYGITKDYVLALRAVLPNGEIIRAGKKTIKDVAGFNLVGLLCGSEGSLAVITEITLKLLARPKYEQVAMGVFARMQDAMNAVYDTLNSGIIPVALEFLDMLTIQALNQKFNKNFPHDAAAILIVQVDSDLKVHLEHQIHSLRTVFLRHHCMEFESEDEKEKSQEIWFLRRNASQSLSIYGKKLNEDITVPRGNLIGLLAGIEKISAKYGFKIACFGHAGDGNVHVNIMIDNPTEENLALGYQAVEELFELVIALEGTLSGEHGIGISKAPFMHLAFSEQEMELMRAIKKAFDPHNILNPSKMGL